MRQSVLIMWLFIIAFVIAAIIAVVRIYTKVTEGWCKSQICLVGKTVIVTGANTGIGYEAAVDFAKRGARVILACRSSERANEARVKIIEETGNENIAVELIDMSSFASVRRFAQRINATEQRLDILVNNAAVILQKNKTSDDGFNLMMQVNHYSVFLLTHLLLDLLKKTDSGRIVNVASIAARVATSFKPETMDSLSKNVATQYEHTKLCNIFFTQELAKKLQGTGVTTYSLHPGTILTEITRDLDGVLSLVLALSSRLISKNVVSGAQTTLHCALQKGLEKHNGQHFSDCKKVAPYKTAQNPGFAKQVWRMTEEIVKLQPDERL